MLKIGEFSRLSQVTVKTLLHYERIAANDNRRPMAALSILSECHRPDAHRL